MCDPLRERRVAARLDAHAMQEQLEDPEFCVVKRFDIANVGSPIHAGDASGANAQLHFVWHSPLSCCIAFLFGISYLGEGGCGGASEFLSCDRIKSASGFLNMKVS